MIRNWTAILQNKTFNLQQNQQALFLRWSGLFTSIMDLVRSIILFFFIKFYFYRGSSQSLVWVKIIRRVKPCLSNQKIRNSKDDIYFLQFKRSEFDRDFSVSEAPLWERSECAIEVHHLRLWLHCEGWREHLHCLHQHWTLCRKIF